MARWYDVAATDAVKPGEALAHAINGVPLALFRLGEEVFAMHDLCPHGQARLSDGFVEGGCVECPLHQGLLDIRTGAPCSPPIIEAVRVYPVRIANDRIEVLL